MFDTTGFDDKTIEKVYRISDIIQKLYEIDFTKQRLVLYGGTSLNFLHIRNIPRLSIDIDFNYRDRQTGDWDKERDGIDKIIKKILSDLHYAKQNINIQAKYPLTRFMVQYTTKSGERDSLKIEIGYMRRIPIFNKDVLLSFIHPETNDTVQVQTPQSEELFGNKLCTLLYRYQDETIASSRDLFDVYTISNTMFNKKQFEYAIVIDSLMRREPRLYQFNVKKLIDNVTVDNQLKNLIHNRKVPADLKQKAELFLEKYIAKVKEQYKDIIDVFFEKYQFKPEILEEYNILNNRIKEHPSILWNLEQLKKSR